MQGIKRYQARPISREDRLKKRDDFANLAKDILDLLPGEAFSESDENDFDMEKYSPYHRDENEE